MTPKPNHRRRKLLIIILLILLLLCSLATVSLNILRGNQSIAVWLGNTAYVLQPDFRSSASHRALSDVTSIHRNTNNNLIIIGSSPIYPIATNMLCSFDNPLLVLGETALY